MCTERPRRSPIVCRLYKLCLDPAQVGLLLLIIRIKFFQIVSISILPAAYFIRLV